MKKIILTLIALIGITASACAMSYEQARNEALFLTDKMAYELNLTDAQYEAAYEINLDYLMNVSNRDNVFGVYWEHRNHDIRCILYAWQWDAFCAATYFYRPLFWEAGYWHFGIYARYPHRTHFYYGRPHFYVSYRGGHSWHHNGGHSYYVHHHDHYRPEIAHNSHFGMRDKLNRGDYNHRSGNSSTRHYGDGNIRNRSLDTQNKNNSDNARNRSTASDHTVRHATTIDSRTTSTPSRDFSTHKNDAVNSIRQNSTINNSAINNSRQSSVMNSTRQIGGIKDMRQSGAMSNMRQSGAMSNMRQSGAMSGARQSSTRQSVSRQGSTRHR